MRPSRILAVLARLLALSGSLALAACSSTGEVVERFDARSGLTIVTDPALVSFARTDGRLSWSARDYIYLGPVEINERGTRTQYLWVGVGSTIDRRFLESDVAVPAVLYVDLDGAPVEFELHPREQLLRGLGALELYQPAVRPELELLARVTIDQLRRLAAAELATVRVAGADGVATEYRLWSEQRAWPAFAGR